MSKCKAVLDSDKITHIRVKVKPQISQTKESDSKELEIPIKRDNSEAKSQEPTST